MQFWRSGVEVGAPGCITAVGTGTSAVKFGLEVLSIESSDHSTALVLTSLCEFDPSVWVQLAPVGEGGKA